MKSRLNRRAYTVVEIVIALAILAVGSSGIIAMQKVTAIANRDAKSLVVANQIARTWVERLRADAARWNHPSAINTSNDLADTVWINQINAFNGLWIRPGDNAVLGYYPTSDGYGNDVPDGSPQGVYCSNLRLTWLYGPPASVPPPYLIRAEVRVFWLRDGGGGVLEPNKSICNTTLPLNPVDQIGPEVTRYHFVYVATAITENMAR
jgi:hypothetical protein